MRKAFKYLLALPFIVFGVIFVILYLLLATTTHLSVYAISFFTTLKHFIVSGKWEWEEIKDETFLGLGRY